MNVNKRYPENRTSMAASSKKEHPCTSPLRTVRPFVFNEFHCVDKRCTRLSLCFEDLKIPPKGGFSKWVQTLFWLVKGKPRESIPPFEKPQIPSFASVALASRARLAFYKCHRSRPQTCFPEMWVGISGERVFCFRSGPPNTVSVWPCVFPTGALATIRL